jgi:hypothetical protein
MNTALLAANLAAAARSRRIDALRAAGATSPAAAIAVSDEDRAALGTALDANVVRATADGRVWLDEAAHAEWLRGTPAARRTARIAIAVLAAIGLALATLLLTGGG